jgi:hypothetical protein
VGDGGGVGVGVGVGAAPAGLIVRSRLEVPVAPLLFVARRVTSNLPAVDGVPLIKPFDLFTKSPLGRPEASKLVGLFVAVI